jgi:hypothetical protein
MPESEMTGNLFLFTNTAATPAPAEEKVKAEARLVERVCEGDEEAFNEIYKIFAPLVHGIVLARVPRDERLILCRKYFFRLIKICTRFVTKMRWARGWR